MRGHIKRLAVASLDRLGLAPAVRRAARALRIRNVPVIRLDMVRVLPHDPGAHTQGLAYASGELFESTGLVGASTLRRIDVATGAVRQVVTVDGVWAEGVAACGDGLLQLTFTEQRALRYRLPTLERDGTLDYEGEGWGLAYAGERFVMSDGSDRLSFRNARFEVESSVAVRLAGRPLTGLNDLEVVDGRILACVLWHSDLYEIDALSGNVLRIVDCSRILSRCGRERPDQLLNGIAFAPDRGTLFVTGKHWPALFEARLAR